MLQWQLLSPLCFSTYEHLFFHLVICCACNDVLYRDHRNQTPVLRTWVAVFWKVLWSIYINIYFSSGYVQLIFTQLSVTLQTDKTHSICWFALYIHILCNVNTATLTSWQLFFFLWSHCMLVVYYCCACVPISWTVMYFFNNFVLVHKEPTLNVFCTSTNGAVWRIVCSIEIIVMRHRDIVENRCSYTNITLKWDCQ